MIVDRLPHHHRIFADIKWQEHHQFAVTRTVEPGDVTAEWQRDVKDAGEISLEEMHHPEDGKMRVPARTYKARTTKLKKSISGEEQHVFDFGHCPIKPRVDRHRRRGSPICSALAPISRARRVKKQETPAMNGIPAHLPALKWNSSRG